MTLRMDDNETITCWNIEYVFSLMGIFCLVLILIVFPIYAGANILSLKYFSEIIEYQGILGFCIYIGFWVGSIYYAQYSFSSFAGIAITKQSICLYKIYSLGREISWTEVSELDIKRTNHMFSEIIITTVQGENLKFRFNTDVKDPTDKILRIRELSMRSK